MKFLCDSCGTKYAISDERVRGRVLKIRCKKCDFVITVREDVQAAAASLVLPSDDEIGAAFDSATNGPANPAPADQTTIGADVPSLSAKSSAAKELDDWYVSFDGDQEGPFSVERAIERVKKEGSGKEAHAWRPGFLVWLPVEEVPELAPALLGPKAGGRAQVRASKPTPIGVGRGSGAVGAQIPKDPSGPRAALAVSTGARPAPSRPAPPGLGAASPGAGPAGPRLDLRKPAAPPIPMAARADAKGPTGLLARGVGNGSGAVANGNGTGGRGMFDSVGVSAQPRPSDVSAAAMFPSAKSSGLSGGESLVGPDESDDDAPALPISNEASGLVNLAHFTAAAFGKAPAGPAFVNGHTAGNPRLQTGRQRALQEPLADLEPKENLQSSAPVVVVSGAAQSGPSPIFKWAALVALIACAGLGAGVWYLLTHRPPPDTIIVTEPSRRTDDTPITMTDPVTGKTFVADPRKTPITGTAGKKTALVRPVGTAVAKNGDNLTGNQKSLADLYKDDGDKATPHDIAGGGTRTGGGGQVSQPAILAVVTANRRALNLCYERVLKHDQSLKQGRVVTQVSIGISGRVTAVTIPDPQFSNSELGQCFVQAVKRWNFPPNDAPYATEFPFILQGQ